MSSHPVRRRRWRRASLGLITALALLVAPLAIAPAQADDEPSSFGLSMVAGTGKMMIAGNEPGPDLANPTSINGSYDAETGQLTDVNFSSPSVTFEQHVTKPITLTLQITEQLLMMDPGSGTGRLEADGTLAFNLGLKLRVQIASTVANGDCYSQPVNVELRSTAPYDPATGRVSLKAEGFRVNNFEVTDKCSQLIVTNSGPQFEGTNNRLTLTAEGDFGTRLEQTTTSLAVAPDEAMNDTETTLTATVAPAAASGTVNFYSGGTSLGDAPVVDGVATTTTKLSAGSHQLRAEYGGDQTYAGSTSASVAYQVRAYATLSGDLPGTVRRGAAPQPFTFSVANPANGRDEQRLRLDLAIDQDPNPNLCPTCPGYGDYVEAEDVVWEFQDGSGAWQRIPFSGDIAGGDAQLLGAFGGNAGFALAAGESRDVPMRLSIGNGSAEGRKLKVTAALVQVDASTGESGATIDSSSATVQIPLAERVPLESIGIDILFGGAQPYRYAQGYDIGWRVRLNNSAVPATGYPDGRVEFFVDGKPRSVTVGAVSGTIQQVPEGLAQITQAVIRTDDLAPGNHTIQVKYLGGTNHLPMLSAPLTFEVLAPFGALYECSFPTLGGGSGSKRMLIDGSADVPAYAGVGSEVDLGRVRVTVGGDLRNRQYASENLTAEIGSSGTASAATGVIENPNAAHNDYRILWDGGTGRTTVSGAAGDLVDVPLDRVRFYTPTGDRQYDCVPVGRPASLGLVRLVGTDLTVSPAGSSRLGELVTMTATVTGGAWFSTAGSVTFRDGNQVLGTVPVAFSTPVSFKTADLGSGAHQLTATWSGGIGFPPVRSAAVEHRVASPTVTTLATSNATPQYGQPITWKATVKPSPATAGTPSGDVQFAVDGNPVGSPVPLVDGVATSAPVANLAVGSHQVTASYAGSTAFGPSTSAALAQVVAKGATSIKATPALVELKGLKLHLTNLSATLTGPAGPVAGETVTFKSGVVPLCTAITAANGVASCSGTAGLLGIILALGYKADFAGSAGYLPSSGKGALIG
ncbi:Ig-like domain repeat protein [Nocardioides marmoriginsengisoli]|uniref:Ig-like domain repeat protein n=1 Tax=Nocardioides marmoriginsengisoli TaxID=661483 RepID=A0A3N0CFP7_9ACTN|nr:Ig-like domain-containing protein [Nocardioides marmoriginsengisoli]RNL62268.1 Ig-like domain repeat protein [Nocardioides marmoriginsengisoli]